MDYFSKWFEVRELNRKTSSEIIRQLIDIFSLFGVPQTIIADNNPFNSFEYREWYFEITASSLYYARSSRLAERSDSENYIKEFKLQTRL